ncbi:hypothetical protein [Arthrobacter sp. Cr_A7]|uniref:hypothetical protein n=1 Tax=Arthrobacter sp. Cr_A7 TaxID=3031017 RepID=UPI0023DB8527|nr:hypothetical protein [Arthrobacter sp. Cr_A7]MDF2052014.1 hypothetical protein [Arthrobacter sp. Cr_A7]
MEFLWPLLGGAVGAAIINGIVGYLRLRADRRDADSKWKREQDQAHESWIRDKKTEAYTEFLEEVQAFIHQFSRYNNEHGTTVQQVLAASGVVKNHRLLLLASSEVRMAQRALGMEINRSRRILSQPQPPQPRDPILAELSHQFHGKRDALLAAAQRDLGITETDGVPIIEVIKP